MSARRQNKPPRTPNAGKLVPTSTGVGGARELDALRVAALGELVALGQRVVALEVRERRLNWLERRLTTTEARVDVWGAELSERVAGKPAEPESYEGPFPTRSVSWPIGDRLWLWCGFIGHDCYLNVGDPGNHGVSSVAMTEPELRRELARWLPLRRGDG